MDIFDLVAPVGELIGLDSAKTAAFLPVVILVSQALGKAIPDKKKGVLGFARKLFKVVGLYVPNNRSESFALAANPDADGVRR